MPTQITALWGGRKVELRETQRAVTPFGGLVVFFEFLRQVGYVEVVNRCLPFRLASPNALDPAQTFTAFLLAVLAGARRFAHASLLRADTALAGGLNTHEGSLTNAAVAEAHGYESLDLRDVLR